MKSAELKLDEPIAEVVAPVEAPKANYSIAARPGYIRVAKKGSKNTKGVIIRESYFGTKYPADQWEKIETSNKKK